MVMTGFALIATMAFGGNKRVADEKLTNSVVSSALLQPVVQSQSLAAEKKLIVYYFMTTYRCKSCLFIEQNTKAAVEATFANELKRGRIEFKMVNIDEAQNKHFVDEYGLYTKSVVLADLKASKQNRWKNLDKVWNLVGDESGFRAYITKEVQAYLGS